MFSGVPPVAAEIEPRRHLRSAPRADVEVKANKRTFNRAAEVDPLRFPTTSGLSATMSHVRRKLFKGKLTDLLARADDEAFFVMVWATFAIQSGRPERARPLLMFPPEAATRDLASKFAVHPWKLETMLNEVLTTPKLKLLSNHPNRRLDCRKFEAIARVTNALARLENAEDGLTLERINVLREIPRITQRQFEWQRGFFSYPQFYRAGFVYGGDVTRAFFAEANRVHHA
jgi:hypothetical protein